MNNLSMKMRDLERDSAEKPLSEYRDAELAIMKKNLFRFDE